MRRGIDQPVNDKGRLRDELLPAVYFETSVLVEYWSAEGIECSRNIPQDSIPRSLPEYEDAARDMFRYFKKLDKMADVRELVQRGDSACVAVTTPLAILELAEWHACASFKQIAVHAAGIVCVERSSRKEIGDYLKRLDEQASEESQRVKNIFDVNEAPRSAIARDCVLNLSFLEYHGLNGVLDVDLKNFSIDATHLGSCLLPLAHYQVGLADLLHIAAAAHLGCKYFASFDSDFRRCRELI